MYTPEIPEEDKELDGEGMVAIVEVGLHALSMQGRDAIQSGVRPNHHIPGKNYCFIGQLNFIDCESLRAGGSCLAEGRFIIAKQDHDLFVPGFAWHLGEAYKIMGHCRLIEVKGFSSIPHLSAL